jgi:hypothetical protein
MGEIEELADVALNLRSQVLRLRTLHLWELPSTSAFMELPPLSEKWVLSRAPGIDSLRCGGRQTIGGGAGLGP